MSSCFFFFQAEDGIRDLVRSRGLGDVYKRQTDSFRLVGRPSQKRCNADMSGIAPGPLLGGLPSRATSNLGFQFVLSLNF